MSDYSTHVSFTGVKDPPMSTVIRVKTMFSTGNNVQILLHKLHDRSISGLVVVLEVAPDDFTEKKSIVIIRYYV